MLFYTLESTTNKIHNNVGIVSRGKKNNYSRDRRNETKLKEVCRLRRRIRITKKPQSKRSKARTRAASSFLLLRVWETRAFCPEDESSFHPTIRFFRFSLDQRNEIIVTHCSPWVSEELFVEILTTLAKETQFQA